MINLYFSSQKKLKLGAYSSGLFCYSFQSFMEEKSPSKGFTIRARALLY
jgi:hypothetical protein